MAKPTIPRICQYCQKPFKTTARDIRRGHGRFCSHTCAGLIPIEERFWRFVRKVTDGCWHWIGAQNERGYGMFAYDGERLAHRVAYKLFKGPIDHQCVLHQCDNPPCVNPDHLFLGTRYDNHLDMLKKARGKKKLSIDDVRAIRCDNRSLKQIALQYDVTPNMISLIQRRKNWSWLD